MSTPSRHELVQTVTPAAGSVALQFALRGLVSVALNTAADVLVAFAVGSVRDGMTRRLGLIRRLREVSGAAMTALGLGLLLIRWTAA
jgi:threonine/homoserine/homoserine lactone efflux protein